MDGADLVSRDAVCFGDIAMALPLFIGMKMERFEPGDRERTSSSAGVMNEFCDVLDALTNAQVIRGESDGFCLGNNALILTIKKSSGEGDGSMVYRGEYEPDPSPIYTVGNVVRVSPSNGFATTTGGLTVPGVYICIKDVADATEDYPQHPLQPGGETLFWNWLSTWPSLIKVCNSDTNSIEEWIIDGQKKPEITADSTRVTADSGNVTADS